MCPGPQHPEPSSVYVDQRALRVDRVTVLERGAPHSVCLMECGKVRHIIYMYCVYSYTQINLFICTQESMYATWLLVYIYNIG